MHFYIYVTFFFTFSKFWRMANQFWRSAGRWGLSHILWKSICSGSMPPLHAVSSPFTCLTSPHLLPFPPPLSFSCDFSPLPLHHYYLKQHMKSASAGDFGELVDFPLWNVELFAFTCYFLYLLLQQKAETVETDETGRKAAVASN